MLGVGIAKQVVPLRVWVILHLEQETLGNVLAAKLLDSLI